MNKFIKVSVLAVVVLCSLFFINDIYYDNHNKLFTANHQIGDALVNDNPHEFYSGPPIEYYDAPGPHIFQNDVVTITLSEVSTTARTYYDLQSNACIDYIQQDPNDKRKMHAIWMQDPVGAAGFPDRRSRYYYSNDTGNTWVFLTQVPDGVRSGFPAITLLSNGIPVVANHSVDGGGLLRTELYNDASIGAGFFNRLDPVQPNAIWPVVQSTANVSLTNKVVFVASVNATNPGDSAYRNVCTSLTGTGTFTGYVFIPQMTNASSYALARGSDGRIGCAFTGRPPSPVGAVYFMESTNNGTTFSTPQQIYNPNYSTDSLACYRSIDIVYQGNVPKVVFGLTVWEPTAGGYYPTRPGVLKLWSPNVNGGNPVTVDTHPGLPNLGQPQLDGFTPICRCTIGLSSDSQAIYVAYNKGRTESLLDNSYFDVYLSYSGNGSSWAAPVRVTNNSGPLRDCRYVSVSDVNHVANSNIYYAHLIFQSDSIPGSFVNGAPQSLARMMYGRIKINNIFTGISSNGNEIPKSFNLYQNYPNPFNPTTKIKFDIPVSSSSNTSITVYNILGEKVASPINENLKPGTYEIDFDASDFPSGIYYYRLTNGSYTETNKMVLLK